MSRLWLHLDRANRKQAEKNTFQNLFEAIKSGASCPTFSMCDVFSRCVKHIFIIAKSEMQIALLDSMQSAPSDAAAGPAAESHADADANDEGGEEEEINPDEVVPPEDVE